MEMVMSNGFAELSAMEMEEIEGGDWKQVVNVGLGTVLFANSLAVGVLAGPGAGLTCAGTGLYLIGCGIG